MFNLQINVKPNEGFIHHKPKICTKTCKKGTKDYQPNIGNVTKSLYQNPKLQVLARIEQTILHV